MRFHPILLMFCFARRTLVTTAFPAFRPIPTVTHTSTRLFSDFEKDGFGRQVRKRTQQSDGWDDWDTPDRRPQRRQERRDKPQRRSSGRFEDKSFRRQHNFRDDRQHNFRDNRRRENRYNHRPLLDQSIPLKELERDGFVHLYGLSSVWNALQANVREWHHPEVSTDQPPVQQFQSHLFVQEPKKLSNGKTTSRQQAKSSMAEEVVELAHRHEIPIAQVSKGVLNSLCGNRPHQGFVLRCGKLSFEPMSRIPLPNDDEDYPSFWLVLDEVVDPQNLGALLRSVYFLGGEDVGVLVCSKNSAPPTPVVSAASAGALEQLTIYSTNNLPRTLQQANADGFRIVGAAAPSAVEVAGQQSDSNQDSSQDSDTPRFYNLHDLPAVNTQEPTLLVLGSEGHGLRTLVAKACTEFVGIPAGMAGASSGDEGETAMGVDSLNVSVTGGILLWQMLQGSSPSFRN